MEEIKESVHTMSLLEMFPLFEYQYYQNADGSGITAKTFKQVCDGFSEVFSIYDVLVAMRGTVETKNGVVIDPTHEAIKNTAFKRWKKEFEETKKEKERNQLRESQEEMKTEYIHLIYDELALRTSVVRKVLIEIYGDMDFSRNMEDEKDV